MSVKTKSLKLQDFMLEGILILIVLYLSFAAKGFASWDNLLNVLRNASTTGIIAFGMTLVIISGEIDISVGSAIAFFGCVAAVLVQNLTGIGWPMVPVMIVAVVTCFVLAILSGMFTGWIRHRFSVPTFITTLAWMAALRGGANLVTGSFPISPFPEWFFFLGSGYVYGIPFQAIVFLVIFAVAYFLSKYTRFGRAVYAIGGNAESARLSGINVQGKRMAIMAITSALTVVAALITSAQIQAGNPTVGAGLEFTVISACVIGGVSLMGGKGRIWGTFIGVMFLEVLLNGMTLLNMDEYWQYVAKAGLILGAVLIYQVRDSRQARA